MLSGFGGSVLSSLFIRNSISVGASGALFGLLGAMLSELFTNWTIYTNKVSNASSLQSWLSVKYMSVMVIFRIFFIPFSMCYVPLGVM